MTTTTTQDSGSVDGIRNGRMDIEDTLDLELGRNSSNNTSGEGTEEATETIPVDKKKKASFPSPSSPSLSSSSSTPVSPAVRLIRFPGCCRSHVSAKCLDCSNINTIWLARALFIAFLAAVAAVLGYAAYLFQYNSEHEVATSQLDAIVDRAIYSARDITYRKMLGAITLKSIYSNSFPSADQWPYVHLQGFNTQIGPNIVKVSKGRGLAFGPIVKPSEVDQFEQWAYNESIPEGEGSSSFGRGVYAFGDANATDNRYHDPTGETTYGSPYAITVPIIQIVNPDPTKKPLYMWNYHSVGSRGTVMDACLDCAFQRKQRRQDQTVPSRSESVASNEGIDNNAYCGTLTDITPPLQQEEPGAVIMMPIFPADSPRDDVVGFLGSSILWSDVLEKAFNNKVSGIDVVLHTSASPDIAYTYRIVEGDAYFHGVEGDFHDPKYDSFKRTTVLTDFLTSRNGDHSNMTSNYELHVHDEGLSDDSPDYFLTIYPSDDYFVIFSTANPKLATVGAVLIIVFTSMLFFLYDALVAKEMRKNHSIIEGRRRFMRFVSHEVRTPLNSVFMGLKLLHQELKSHFRHGQIESRIESVSELFSNEAINALLHDDDNEGQNSKNSRINTSRGTENTPLVIQSTTGHAQDMLVLSKQILASAQSSIDILNDLLNYDKIETGRLQLEREVVSIRELVDKVVSEFLLPYKAKGVTLEVDPFSNEYDQHDEEGSNNDNRVVADPMKLTLVFRNLLSNALKFTPSGGTVTLERSREAKLSQVVSPTRTKMKLKSQDGEDEQEEDVSLPQTGTFIATVCDTGVGMSSDQISSLFKAGVQYNSKQMQDGGGSGLGLYIAKGILNCHGGDLVAQSAGMGKGSKFTVRIPIYEVPDRFLVHQRRRSYHVDDGSTTVRADDSVASAKQHHQQQNKCAHMHPPVDGPMMPRKEPVKPKREFLKVLVVDDSLMNRKLLVRLLERKGHKCDQAVDGVQALERVKKSTMTTSSTTSDDGGDDKTDDDDNRRPYDSILLDYEMPNLDGPSAVQQMRVLPGFSSYVVGITGNVLPEDVAYFKKCGADEVLPKPLDIRALTELWTTKAEILQESFPSAA